MEYYIIGDTLTCNVSYFDLDGAPYDPSTIELSIYDPDGSLIETVTYADSEIVRSEEGIYFYDFEISGNPGYYVTKFEAHAADFHEVSEDQFHASAYNSKLYVSVSEVKSALMAEASISMNDNDIRRQIQLAMSEVDTVTGQNFINATITTEWFDIMTRNPNIAINQLYLSTLPVQDIISVKEYNRSTHIKTYTTDDYYLSDNFIVQLYQGSFKKGFHTIECVYTHGYEAIPAKITLLTSVISQLAVLRHYMISQDSEQTAFTVDGFGSVAVGETYMTAELALKGLKIQKDQLIKEIGSLKNDIFVI